MSIALLSAAVLAGCGLTMPLPEIKSGERDYIEPNKTNNIRRKYHD